MKFLGIVFFLSLSIQVFSQSGQQFFGQAMIDINDKNVITTLQDELRKNPKVKVVRIDALSRQIFLITNELDSWNSTDFISMFGENSSKLNCVYVGIYGKDQIKKFPFSDCE